ncbi:MAG: serine hydrolase domain-containing protein [Microscillaceae bacterium]|nr:serine hydrolase domain-containing protein [Microscillaceae bacterium]
MKNLKFSNYIFLLMWITFSSCKKEELALRDTTELQKSFQKILDDIVAEDELVFNGILLVDIPKYKLHWKSAVGKTASNTALPPDAQFRTASIGKTFLAALALRLVEDGKIALDDKLSKYLPVSIMNNLMVYNGTDYSNQITIRQCLTHTSGIGDYFFENPDENGFPQFIQLILGNPEQFWTPQATIEYTKENIPPHFEPGKGFFYSDTGYNLVGLALENATSKSLNDLYKEYIFNPLNLKNTYMEFREPPRGGVVGIGVSQSYFLDIDITDFQSISADWAGGGLITNTEDLYTFINALTKGTFFKKSDSFSMMQQGFIEEYGMGWIKQSIGGELIVGHDGSYSSFMYKWNDITITGTLNQFEPKNGSFKVQLIEQLIQKIKAFN